VAKGYDIKIVRGYVNGRRAWEDARRRGRTVHACKSVTLGYLVRRSANVRKSCCTIPEAAKRLSGIHGSGIWSARRRECPDIFGPGFRARPCAAPRNDAALLSTSCRNCAARWRSRNASRRSRREVPMMEPFGRVRAIRPANCLLWLDKDNRFIST